ncbi:MAG TPA: hypothetical protein VNA19_00735 [Pyrinomonadaceae bacterium]|jgi:hypothetical protein|nr:hypothetical protein [Pyrinomonadaceae bacterium]
MLRKYRRRLLPLFIVLGIGLISVSAMLQKRGADKAKPMPPEEATLIQEGVMTAKQKEHSKLFKGYTWFSDGKKIKDIAAQKDGEIEVNAPLEDTLRYPQPSLGEYLQKMTCEADAVVIASVKSKSSNLTESGTFLFTDYEVTVREVLKNQETAPIRQGQDITVTRGGGAVKLNGRIIRAIDTNAGRLQVGREYLLYLRFVPATGAYRPFGNAISEDSFQIDGGKTAQISRKQWPLGQYAKAETDAFLGEAREALHSQCRTEERRQ